MAQAFKVYPTVSDFAFEQAVWVFGGYPQVDHDTAIANVRRQIEEMGHHELRPLTLWLLGRKTFGIGYQYPDFMRKM